MTGAYQATPGA